MTQHRLWLLLLPYVGLLYGCVSQKLAAGVAMASGQPYARLGGTKHWIVPASMKR